MSENATDSAGDGPDSVELLEWLDGQMRAITEQIDDPPDPLLDGCEAAACVHSIMTTGAQALRTLARWYASNGAGLFDQRHGAEQDATALVRASERGLRAFAKDIEAVTRRHAPLIGDLRELRHRAIYEVTLDDGDEDPDEYYAVVEVEYSSARERRHRRYERLDVARDYAQRLARRGTPGNDYRVIPVIAGQALPHIAQWPGEGDSDD
jgi:hypothetical protein